ncbi:hypothetical protein AALP_AA1G200500 [Arabis alpina]|uniref:Bifunctional inhibitor/plant lipid transfer protein/seed storage helical domain-containing protein n=1 Tax=Arabis alpina TaxID=50452 RepID=A0A087HPD8_ARAAL|nr:hypothetical protein AALP_AA1G200500 [Arabis alpina]
MEIVKIAVAVVLVLCSVTANNAAIPPPSATGGSGGDAHSLPCIQKLMPCQPYLHSATPPPPPTCCMPLREIVENDVTCLCAVFNNVDMLKSLNLTKDNALLLPKACGANADVSKCRKASSGTTPSSTTAPATPTTPPASSTGNGTTGGSTGDSATSTAKSSDSAPAINFVGLGFASAIVATLCF